ncbi:MAG: hypothetical protein ABIH65_04225 [Nanoarchaeota archaeon]
MDFSKLFRDFIGNSDIDKYIDLVRKNSKGKIWLIGGFVYKNIVGIIKEKKQIVNDLDFLVENPSDIMNIPEKYWKMGITSYGNPFFIYSEKREKISIDLNYISSFHSIVSRNLPPIIESFLSGTPLTIQSIAYDLDECKIIGETGISAITKKLIEINNIEEARYETERRKITFEEYLKEKAIPLGLNWRLPTSNSH